MIRHFEEQVQPPTKITVRKKNVRKWHHDRKDHINKEHIKKKPGDNGQWRFRHREWRDSCGLRRKHDPSGKEIIMSIFS